MPILTAELRQDRVDRAGVIEGKNAFQDTFPIWLSYLQALKSQGIIAWNGEAREVFTGKAGIYSLFLEELLHLLPFIISARGL